MAANNEWLDFFSTVHTSKGIYRQPKFAIHDFLETGEREATPEPPPVDVSTPIATVTKPNPIIKPFVAPPPKPKLPPSSTIMVTESKIISAESTILESKNAETVSERETSVIYKSDASTIIEDSDDTICDKSEDPEFSEKLEKAIEVFKKGLPSGQKFKIAIPYAINLIKPADGKEELWFEALKYDEIGKQLHLKLIGIPDKVKYLKEGSIIKPTLEKIQKFYFQDES
ncbi:MAG: hypothetical protein COA79_06635 [Planctomycetota bacterium]|nr:MAG: hypothetical protein COA79_06635 [Planctomycetota bacterium]